MYNRINGSSYFQSSHFAETDEQMDADNFADAFANMRLAESGSSGSSSSATRPYSLVSTPPIIEFRDRQSFRKAAEAYHGDEINYIADNPQEYSDFVSAKARRTAEVAKDYGTTRDSENARYFSYQLGNKSVGLLRMEGGDSMTEFDVKRWKKLFPGRHGTTSTVDLQVVHPLVENAGDILLEHQLRIDGEQPLLNLRPANPEARARAAKMGFVEVDADNMVLDPEKSDKWVRNSDGDWQRKGTAARYLSKADDSEGSDTEIPASPSTYDYEDDFM
ncbi:MULTISPECIES: Effector protein NopP [unclassified Bradyrhizobium]|uniref:Effector protein NopP n=1 Tax=unclassified Bradyrhizobium TaxID=2631580 RepID=UPI00247A35D5|nr:MULTISPECIES: Effector protein NopP [unclassified Bradyrhizobium]WGR72696.1 Effector protein NopP [Bradyrhizobium sp. ISRA426]WGR77529.1 Effector protein NopP [Bradyrhizobium sp. ISRA430]WGR87935.1 Effector protein NopP [Bradyrhizobium sp. ISRA432]